MLVTPVPVAPVVAAPVVAAPVVAALAAAAGVAVRVAVAAGVVAVGDFKALATAVLTAACCCGVKLFQFVRKFAAVPAVAPVPAVPVPIVGRIAVRAWPLAAAFTPAPPVTLAPAAPTRACPVVAPVAAPVA